VGRAQVKIGVIAAGLMGCIGCSQHNPGPNPVQVLPASGTHGQVTPIRILGHGFRPRFRANLDEEQKARVESHFGAELGDTPLLAVTLVSSGELTARVPGTVPVGTHSLMVIDPDGLRGVLEDAFTVHGPPKEDGGPGDGRTDGPRPDGSHPDGLPDTQKPDLPDQMLPDVKNPSPDLKKPLGALCLNKSECISGHCIKVPYMLHKVCCFQNCADKEWNDGCSIFGTQCIDG
jgi:hypothetical protein